ncbi:hypothetical protein ABEX29_26865 [Brevibacillus porteri]|uniref:hypothetical protein n=1 Tax=Brevibacillus porteri TaxID=2126350 RepID=UPI003D2332B7
MFCNFYFGGYSEFSELKISLKSYLQDVQITETDDKITVSYDGFTLFINEGGHGAMFASEDYSMELKYSCYIDIIASYTNWAYELMVFIGKVLSDIDGDCILELNDKPILLRKNDVITVDGKKLSGTVDFPFYGLGLDFQVGDIA